MREVKASMREVKASMREVKAASMREVAAATTKHFALIKIGATYSSMLSQAREPRQL
jgi:hypothetical protein